MKDSSRSRFALRAFKQAAFAVLVVVALFAILFFAYKYHLATKNPIVRQVFYQNSERGVDSGFLIQVSVNYQGTTRDEVVSWATFVKLDPSQIHLASNQQAIAVKNFHSSLGPGENSQGAESYSIEARDFGSFGTRIKLSEFKGNELQRVFVYFIVDEHPFVVPIFAELYW